MWWTSGCTSYEGGSRVLSPPWTHAGSRCRISTVRGHLAASQLSPARWVPRLRCRVPLLLDGEAGFAPQRLREGIQGRSRQQRPDSLGPSPTPHVGQSKLRTSVVDEPEKFPLLCVSACLCVFVSVCACVSTDVCLNTCVCVGAVPPRANPGHPELSWPSSNTGNLVSQGSPSVLRSRLRPSQPRHPVPLHPPGSC